MFVLARLRLPVRLPPSSWSRPLDTALVDALNARMGNKILHEVGLVVSVWDLLDIGDSFLFPGDGASHTKVTFRAVVFRPFLEEVLTGKIKSCTPQGVNVTLGFFDDILIPPEALQHPYRFDDNEQVWVWEYPTDDGPHDMFMDPGEEIRFRVTREFFVDTSPTAPEPAKPPPAQQGVPVKTEVGGVSGGGAPVDALQEQEEKKIPYMIHASVNEPGLGLLSWWAS